MKYVKTLERAEAKKELDTGSSGIGGGGSEW